MSSNDIRETIRLVESILETEEVATKARELGISDQLIQDYAEIKNNLVTIPNGSQEIQLAQDAVQEFEQYVKELSAKKVDRRSFLAGLRNTVIWGSRLHQIANLLTSLRDTAPIAEPEIVPSESPVATAGAKWFGPEKGFLGSYDVFPKRGERVAKIFRRAGVDPNNYAILSSEDGEGLNFWDKDDPIITDFAKNPNMKGFKVNFPGAYFVGSYVPNGGWLIGGWGDAGTSALSYLYVNRADVAKFLEKYPSLIDMGETEYEDEYYGDYGEHEEDDGTDSEYDYDENVAPRPKLKSPNQARQDQTS